MELLQSEREHTQERAQLEFPVPPRLCRDGTGTLHCPALLCGLGGPARSQPQLQAPPGYSKGIPLLSQPRARCFLTQVITRDLVLLCLFHYKCMKNRSETPQVCSSLKGYQEILPKTIMLVTDTLWGVTSGQSQSLDGRTGHLPWAV